MIKIKYIDGVNFIEVGFKRINSNIVRITNGVVNTNGFKTYSLDEEELGDFSDYTTVYSNDDVYTYYSNDESVENIGDTSNQEAESATSVEEIKNTLIATVQEYMDEKASERGYDGILSVCSYVETGIDKFDREGELCRQWRSKIWATCYSYLDKVLEGEMDIPTKDELISMLPELNWEDADTIVLLRDRIREEVRAEILAELTEKSE